MNRTNHLVRGSCAAWFLFCVILPVPTTTANVEPAMRAVPHEASTVSLSATELTWIEWRTVRAWALENGYDLGPGRAEGDRYPVATITWYDAIKFCNAASQMFGRTPVYYTTPDHEEVYRAGEIDLTEACVKHDADGYRLPTESEWETACRAGTATRYYWGDAADPAANPYAWHTDARSSGQDLTPHPVGLKQANSWGMYDMSGNVAEWCWDRARPDTNWRVLRGGSVALDSDISSDRRDFTMPSYRVYDVGLRLASNDPACPPLAQAISARGVAAPPAAEAEPIAPAYDGKDTAAVASELFALLDTERPDVRPAWRLHQQGRHEEALNAWRDTFVEHLQAHLHRTRYQPNARFWNGSEGKGLDAFRLDPDRILWFRAADRPDNPYDAQAYFQDTRKLIAAWIRSGDEALLDQWFGIADAFARRAKVDFDNLSSTDLARPIPWGSPQSWAFGMGLTEYGDKLIESLSRIVAHRPDHAASRIPARQLANILIFIATTDAAKTIKDPRDCVSNQQLLMARVLITQSFVLSHFRDATAWYDLGCDRIRSGALDYFILPDGGDREQSFNYNIGLYPSYHELAAIFRGRQTPEWLEQFHTRAVWRKRMLASLRLASGAAPSVGNNSYGRDLAEQLDPNDPLDDPLVSQIHNRLVADNARHTAAPAFTSIAFPFSGYYVQRDGWDPNSSALFFKSSMPSVGHGHPDNNSIDLTAYGRHLLVNRESPPYGDHHLSDNQKKDYPWVLEYKGEHAFWMENTLMIDGCGQTLGPHPGPTSAQPMPDNAWYTSEAIDYVQGVYTGRFTSPPGIDEARVLQYADRYQASPEDREQMLDAARRLNATPPRHFNATHTRQVIYLRHANAWIVIDRVKPASPDHVPAQVTQLWHLPSPRLDRQFNSLGSKFDRYSPLRPGFEPEHVTCDPRRNLMVTTHDRNVNLAMLHASPEPIRYETFFGHKYPYRGWANEAPSMVSDYVPAVDIHATAPAALPLVTLLVPIPQGRTLDNRLKTYEIRFEEDRVILNAAFDDGSAVTLVAAISAQELQLDGAQVSGHTALLLRRGDDPRRGLVIDDAGRSYAFVVEADTVSPTAPITAPTGFDWAQTPAGLVPVYP